MRWFYFVSLYHSQNGNMTEWRIRGDNANLRHRMQKRDFIIVSSAWVQMSDPTHKHCCAPLFSSCGQNILPFYSRFEFKWFGPRRIIFCCSCLQILYCYVNVSNVREESTLFCRGTKCALLFGPYTLLKSHWQPDESRTRESWLWPAAQECVIYFFLW